LAAAAYDDAHEDGTIFAGAIGPGYDMAKLPATAYMLYVVVRNEAHMSAAVKTAFHRDRPWIVDPSIKTCSPHRPGPAANSYPSGHTSVGYAMATVLASLMPTKTEAIMARAQVFAENRIVCGYHFRSDIEAGKTFGTFVANELLHNPQFQPQYQAAAAELQAAHLAP
jgi:acid phosphatase (class A)